MKEKNSYNHLPCPRLMSYSILQFYHHLIQACGLIYLLLLKLSMKCIIPSYKYHLSWYCQTWSWRNITAVLQGMTKNTRAAKGKRLQKLVSSCPIPFTSRRQTASPKLCYAGTEAVLPDQPVITGMTRYSAFSSLVQAKRRATWNSPSAGYTWPATGVRAAVRGLSFEQQQQ